MMRKVHALAPDATAAEVARKPAAADGLLGAHVVIETGSPAHLPLGDWVADLLVVTDATDANLPSLPTAEAGRVLAPYRGTAVVGNASGTKAGLSRSALAEWAQGTGGTATVQEDAGGLWAVVHMPALEGGDDRGHHLHAADGNLVSRDTAFTGPPLELQRTDKAENHAVDAIPVWDAEETLLFGKPAGWNVEPVGPMLYHNLGETLAETAILRPEGQWNSGLKLTATLAPTSGHGRAVFPDSAKFRNFHGPVLAANAVAFVTTDGNQWRVAAVGRGDRRLLWDTRLPGRPMLDGLLLSRAGDGLVPLVDGRLLAIGGGTEEKDQPPVIPSQPLASVSLDQYVMHPLRIEGGVGHIAWSISGGKLPHGLRLSPDGVLVGSPGEEGEFTFAVKAQDAFPGGPRTAERTLTWKIGPASPETLVVKAVTVTGKPDDKMVVIDDKEFSQQVWRGDANDAEDTSHFGTLVPVDVAAGPGG